MEHTYWGIDLGGTKIEGVVLGSVSPDSTLIRKRIATEAHLGYEHIVNQVVILVDLIAEEVGFRPDRLGIGTPGTLDPATKTMKGCNTTALNGQPLLADLEKKLNIEVRIANDANCFALAEAELGVIQQIVPDFQAVFGIIMGTGVGGGLVLRAPGGKSLVRNGLHGIGGEWGHNLLEHEGFPCYCGRRGCVEQVLSGPALEQYYFTLTQQKIHLPEIVTNYRLGSDEAATRTMERLFDYFGQAVSVLVNILDPDAIVIGGGVGNIDELYTEGPKRAIKYVFNHSFDTPILRPQLGDSAGVFGAAMLTI